MLTKNIRSLSCFAVVLLFFFGYIISAYAQQINPEWFKQLKYRFIGPQGNRVIAVVGVPKDPDVYYIGAASGGIFKTTDGGTHWKPIFDEQPVSSVGSLAIAPSDQNIIWAGTGETFIRSNISIGNGIYKSTDAGKTWKLMGLEKTGRIGRIIIDPHDPNIVFAATMGHCYGPQKERGVYRTIDGGKTWENVLFVDENTGCSDIVMDPNNRRILFAGMWQLEIKTWGRVSGGPSSGLYMSQDGGTTWKQLSNNGLPKSPIGKIALAMSPDNSERIYALIESDEGVLWKSDDGGDNWKMINHDHTLTQRPHYYSRCAVAPDDHNEIYFCAVQLSVSLDGGLTFKRARLVGGDNHDMWIDPLNPDRMVVGNDQVVAISVNRGKSWVGVPLPIAQMYHVAVDNQIPYYVYGNRQDGPSTRGPSNSLTYGGITSGMWHSVGGCECGFAIPDPVDNNIVWSGCYGGFLDRFDLRTGHSHRVSAWPDNPMGWPAADLKYRFQWTFPIAISPHDHDKVYIGSQYVHQTTDGGHSWKIISPDLSTNNKSKQQSSGGITPDNASVEYCCLIFALAESPVEEGVIWAGTNDGLVWITRDGGENWTNVTKNIPKLPPWGIVSNIEPSKYNAGTCYITIDFHQVNNREPYIYKTANYGKSWKFISSDIPKSVLSYAHCIREDPVREGLLYLGTENALYVSFNDGENWLPLQSNLPHAPVHWLIVQEHFNDLVVATYGRGFYILDDITPLQQLNKDIINSDVHLFAPRSAYRYRFKATPMSQPGDPCAGKNPPYGVSMNYYLKSEPEEKVKITIHNEKGEKIRTLEGTKEVGLNRVWWDLQYEPIKEVKLRTSPIGSPHVKTGEKGWRPLATWGGKISILAAPGTYTVKLAIGEKEYSQKLTVKKDPHSTGTEEDIEAQTELLLEIRKDINNVVEMINQIELIRKQIYDLNELLKGEENSETLMKAGKALDKKFIAIEENLIQMKLTGAWQDALRWPIKLYAKLNSLAGGISSSDFPPTTQQIEVYELFKRQLSEYQSCYKELLAKDFSNFNNLLRENKIPNIIAVKNP